MNITGNRASIASLLQTESVDFIRVGFVLIESTLFEIFRFYTPSS